jgi:hypothetical protein
MPFRRKQREMVELEQDPNFAFYVGRLIGASEMTAFWLQLQAGADAKEMGRRLNKVVGWFLTDEMEEPPAPTFPPDQSTKAMTQKTPPPLAR